MKEFLETGNMTPTDSRSNGSWTNQANNRIVQYTHLPVTSGMEMVLKRSEIGKDSTRSQIHTGSSATHSPVTN